MYPYLINTSFLKIPSYGVMVALGFGLAIYYCYKKVKNSGLSLTGDDILSIATFLIIFSMLGARLFYVIQFWADFQGDWLAVFLFRQREGFVFYGGLIAGLIYLIWYCRKYKVDFWKFMDFVMPAGALGYAVGRIGCFLNGCCFGAESEVPWAIIFPHSPGVLRHPTQLYDVFFGFALFFFLKYWNENKKMFSGQVFIFGISAYSIERFLVEMIRVNPVYGPFSQAQWISIAMLIGCVYLYRRRANSRSIN